MHASTRVGWQSGGVPPAAASHPLFRPTSSSAPPRLLLPGYARVAAALYAFAVALRDPRAAVLAYAASFVCDELDGRFARKLDQCSTLGSGQWDAGWRLGLSMVWGTRR